MNVDALQFGFISGRGTKHALFVVRRKQGKCRYKEKVVYVLC